MVQETLEAATNNGIDWTTVITAAIGLIGGGAILKIYEAYAKNKRVRRLDGNSENFTGILQNRVQQLESKVDDLNTKITELIESNAEVVIKLTAENATLVERNQRLRDEIATLKEAKDV